MEFGRRIGNEIFFVFAAEKRMKFLADMREVDTCTKAQNLLPMVALAPETANSHSPIRFPILMVVTPLAKEAIKPRHRTARQPKQSRAYPIDPRFGLRCFAAQHVNVPLRC